MARFPSDGLLQLLVRAPVGALRLWAARRAAGRALHVAALRGASEDPYVLARLGLHHLAIDIPAQDETARFGQLLAKTALGRIGALAEAGRLDGERRSLLAKALAPHAPMAALKYLDENEGNARAACLAAAGRAPDSAGDIFDHGGNAEGEAVAAHFAVGARQFRAARKHINRLFGHASLSAPLDVVDDAFTLDHFRSRTLLPQNGPCVSIVVPYQNDAATLATAVESLGAQSWRDIEILLVEDRSSDDSPAIAQRLAASDERIRLLSNIRGQGVYGARNSAIDAATGEYVTFLDADDWSPPERIARQMGAIGKAAVAIANHIRIDAAGAPIAPRVFPLVRPVPITMMARRETLLAAGPFEEVETGADSEMLARLEMLHGRSATYRDAAVLLVARWRRGSLSEAREGGMFGAERIAYRTQWMFRHAGLPIPQLASDAVDGPQGGDVTEGNED